MAYVEVDVDLKEFDTDDLIQELVYRINRRSFLSRKDFSVEKQVELKEIIKKEFADLPELFSADSVEGLEIKTLEDKMKLEHIVSVFNRYTLAQLQNTLP